MSQEDSQIERLIAEYNEDKVEHELMWELWLDFFELDESVLNKYCFVLPFPLFTEMHEVYIEGGIVLIEVRVVILDS